ncbi:alpha/beta fold hydrolase [Candidatus Kaiserbacteria bacterium]|nr:alpha/beta fold hydrolase [Candidatus Kaiserbacteria bacterium]
MRPAYIVQIVTPKKFELDGLWLGPKKAKKVVVWVHGLGSSMFRKLGIADELVDNETAVLVFNNRGHDKIARIHKTSGKSFKGGSVHEVFTECVDDIDGAVRYARENGAKQIFVVGHSTGCQKAAYWGSKRKAVADGIILLSPMSDYSAERMASGKKALVRAEKVARAMVAKGRAHDVLPESVWPWPWIADAQRFLSLYTGKSPEEIFTYWEPQRPSATLRRVTTSLLAVIPEKDEYAEMSTKTIGKWFAANVHNGTALVFPGAGHSFRGHEKDIARSIRAFMKEKPPSNV